MIKAIREQVQEINYLLQFPEHEAIVLNKWGKKYRMEQHGDPIFCSKWETAERMESRVDGVLRTLRLLNHHNKLI